MSSHRKRNIKNFECSEIPEFASFYKCDLFFDFLIRWNLNFANCEFEKREYFEICNLSKLFSRISNCKFNLRNVLELFRTPEFL